MPQKGRKDPFGSLLNGLWTTETEWKKLRTLEKNGQAGVYARALARLDKKQALRGLKDIKGLDRKKVKPAGLWGAPSGSVGLAAPQMAAPSATLLELLAQKKAACDCVIPCTFSGFRTYGAMNGPDADDVRQGILGACRLAAGEYTLSNCDNSDGTWRFPLGGSMQLFFSGVIPRSGQHYLLLHPGLFWVKGHGRVVGHGNMTTGYDAKVWVDHYMIIDVNGAIVELSGGEVLYDGTRSDDRRTDFRLECPVESRYVSFYARKDDVVTLSFRLNANTEANADGIATIVVDYYGFPANTKKDYDTLIVRSS